MTNVSQETRAFQATYKDRSIPVSTKRQKRSWNVRMLKNDASGRWRWAKIPATAIAFLACSSGTLCLGSARQITIVWLIGLAVFMISDGFDFFSRFLAFQSRLIISINCSAIAAMLAFPGRNIGVLAGIIASSSVLLIKTLNNKWLLAENWGLTEIGRKALESGEESRAMKSWQAHGRRETAAMMVQLGIESGANVLDVVHKPVWLAGYMRAWQVLRGDQVEDLTAKLGEARDEITRLTADLRDANKQIKRYSEDADEMNDYTNVYMVRIEKLEQEKADLLARIADLVKTNEELIKEPVSLTEKIAEHQKIELIASYMDQGMSQTKAGAKLGMSKAATSRLLAKAREEGLIG